MKHNGEISGKKSISDWVNRRNDMIKKKIDSQTDASDDKKRRGGDEKANDLFLFGPVLADGSAVDWRGGAGGGGG